MQRNVMMIIVALLGPDIQTNEIEVRRIYTTNNYIYLNNKLYYKMAKTKAYLSFWILIITIAIIVVVDINVKSNNNNHTYYYETFAADKIAATSLPIQAKDTFSAIGTINSLDITIPESGFNITDVFKVILSGEWNLSVHKGNVTNFAVNFLASPMDGTKPHIHQITNFKIDNIGRKKQLVQLTSDNSLSLKGTTDVKINGVTVWNNVHVSILISKGNTMTLSLNDKETGHHFGKQPIYGIVSRLIV